MYRLNFDGWPLYDPRGANKTDRLIIRDPDVQIGVNMAGSVKFTIDPGHPNADKVTKLHGTLELTDDAGVLFRGRVLDERQTFYNAVEYTAEGALAWLNDGIVEPYDFPADFQADPAYQAAAASGNVVAFFLGWLLDGYNAHALPERQIKLGTVTVADPNNYITRADTNYPSTFEVISKKLAGSQLGGYLVMRYEADGNYLDYLSTFTGTNAQQITFGENLLDLVRECSAADVCTAVLPVGAEGLTLEGLPDGPQENGLVKAGKVLYNPQAEADYGRIIRKVEYSDITQAQNLLRTAAKDMGAEIRLPESLQVQACDLHYLDGTVPSFRLGLYTVIVSAPHDIVRKSYPLTELRPNILNPGATPITLNGTAAQLTARLRQAQQAEQERTDSAMRAVVKQASDMLQEILEQASGLYCTPEAQADGSTIYYLHDKPTLADSKNVIKLTADAIGFSTDGGHSYPYGFTVTGDMVARVLSAYGVNADWINAGTVNLGKLRVEGDLGGIAEGQGRDQYGPTRGLIIYGPAGLDADGNAIPPYIIMTDKGFRVQIDADRDFYFVAGSNLVVNSGERVNGAFRATGRIRCDSDMYAGQAIWLDQDMVASAPHISVFTSETGGLNLVGYSRTSSAEWLCYAGGRLVIHGGDITSDVAIQTTSDRDAKKDIEPLEYTPAAPAGASDSPQEAPSIDGDPNPTPSLATLYEAFVDALTPVRFHYKEQAAADAPLHIGYIYQDALAALEAVGLGKADLAALGEGLDENGNVHRGIAYSELIPLLHLKIKRQAAEMDALAARITALEAR